jgi:hypothetical protein
MLATHKSGIILIRDHTPLPAGMAIERDVFLPGWKAVKDSDGYQLGRKIKGAKWNFFYLAGEIRVTVLGSGSKTLRRAVKRALAKQEKQFNSLEITSVVSKRFRGLPFVGVVAHTRHIQQGARLVSAKDFVLEKPVPDTVQTGISTRQVQAPTKPIQGSNFKFLGIRWR